MTPELAARALEEALRSGGDFAEIFAEDRRSLNVRLEDGRIEAVTAGTDRGVSIRVVRGDSTVFGYTESPSDDAVLQLARRLSGDTSGQMAEAVKGRESMYRPAVVGAGDAPLETPAGISAHHAGDLLRAADEGARSLSGEVVQVLANVAALEQRVSVANSRGVFASDHRRRAFLAATVVGRRESVVQTGRETLALTGEFDAPSPAAASALAAEAAGKALIMLDAGPAPTGSMPVILANGFGGVLFHEACGHGLEADFILKRTSVWEGKLGERVAPAFLTAYDDGVGAGLWGTNRVDDEGTPTARTAVIEEGILVSYLTDVLRGDKLNLSLTGNGRRESFRHLPYPRMTNTYFAPGSGTAADIIADTPRAFFAKSLSGGEVNPATGDFVFGVSEGYLVENGRVGPAVRGATLIGNGLQVLMGIDAVAADLDVKAGFCGKEGQLVPVGTGQPTIRIREMTIGGTDVG